MYSRQVLYRESVTILKTPFSRHLFTIQHSLEYLIAYVTHMIYKYIKF